MGPARHPEAHGEAYGGDKKHSKRVKKVRGQESEATKEGQNLPGRRGKDAKIVGRADILDHMLPRVRDEIDAVERTLAAASSPKFPYPAGRFVDETST